MNKSENLETAQLKFDEAKKLQSNEDYEPAIAIYKSLLRENSYDKFEVLVGLGACYFFSNSIKESCECLKEATILESNNETASLGLYLSYVESEEYDLAINEMNRYLYSNDADLYRDTIVELIEEIKRGNAIEFKEKIYGFATKNGIVIDE